MSRDYLRGVDPDDADFQAQVVQRVDDGLTRVYVNYMNIEEDQWIASWQTASDFSNFEGTRDQVITWARSQEADKYMIFDPAAGDYVPMVQD